MVLVVADALFKDGRFLLNMSGMRLCLSLRLVLELRQQNILNILNGPLDVAVVSACGVFVFLLILQERQCTLSLRLCCYVRKIKSRILVQTLHSLLIDSP